MTNRHCDVWEQIVSTEDEKKAALRAAVSNRLQWISTSRVESPDGKGFIPGVYRMRFAEVPSRKRAPIKFAGYDYRDRARR
jgi:hypothetical protein